MCSLSECKAFSLPHNQPIKFYFQSIITIDFIVRKLCVRMKVRVNVLQIAASKCKQKSKFSVEENKNLVNNFVNILKTDFSDVGAPVI